MGGKRTRWCFLRAAHPISREPLAVYRLHFRSLKSSRSRRSRCLSRSPLLLVFVEHDGGSVQTGFSLLKSITAGRRDERATRRRREGEGSGGKEIAERGNKWGITSGTEVAELISKTGGVIAGILKASRMNSATTANIPFPLCTLRAISAFVV